MVIPPEGLVVWTFAGRVDFQPNEDITYTDSKQDSKVLLSPFVLQTIKIYFIIFLMGSSM